MGEPTVTSAVFRLPRSAYLAVLFLVFCITPFVQHPALVVLYVVPLVIALFIARSATVVTPTSITVRALLGRRVMPWSQVRSFAADRRGRVSVVTQVDGTRRAWRLPFVRARHLPALNTIGGRDDTARAQRPITDEAQPPTISKRPRPR